jgi:TolA-binding protein
MSFLRRWLLIGFALVLSGESLLAAGTREERAYAAAAAAFHDEAWNRAETEFAQFVQKYPKATNAPAAVLLQAQAELKQGKVAEALGLLAGRRAMAGRWADQYEYWTAQAQFQGGDFAAAAAAFDSVVQQFPESPLRLRAAVEAAAAYLPVNDWAQIHALLADTNSIFQRAARLDAGNELVARGRLLLAQAEFAQQHFAAATAVLNQLHPATLPPELDWQRAYLLAQVRLGAGDLDGALAVTTNLTPVQRRGDFLAESAALRGMILEKSGRWPEALAAWSENLAPNLPPERQREALLKIAALAAAQTNLPAAEDALKTFLNQSTNAFLTALARLTLAELGLQEYVATPSSNRLAAAQANFDQFIGTFTNSALVGKAYLDRGWCYWLATNFPASLADFQQAAALLPFSADLAVAKFKLGDTLFAQNDFAGARENYAAVLTQFDALPAVAPTLGDRALYQMLRASLALKDPAAAETAMRRLLERFPHSELADKGLLLAGEGFSDFGSPTNARAVFQDFAKKYPGSPLRPQVTLALARTYESEQDWRDAIATYEQWRGDFATNALRPQMEYALAQANFHAGNEAQAFGAFTNFVAQYPADTNAPAAQWWVADHFFRAGDFPAAELNYENIFQNPSPVWRGSPLAYPAQLMAGRAAMARQGFPDAKTYLTRLLNDTNCPPALATQALFAYGRVLTRMDSPDTNRPFANFEMATNVFAQIYAANPTNETGALAWSETADCDLQLGAFDAATNAFAQVVNSAYAGSGLRSRAEVGLGLTLEKKAALLSPEEQKPLLELALDCYRNVFDDDDVAADFWVKKAGLQALPLILRLGDGDADKFFDRLELKLPALTEMLEKKRAALKN